MAIVLGFVLPLIIQQEQLRSEIFINVTQSGMGLQYSLQVQKSKGGRRLRGRKVRFSQHLTNAPERFWSQLGNQDTFSFQGKPK